MNIFIKQHVNSVLRNQGFVVKEINRNVICFSSINIDIYIVYNRLENSYLIELGYKDGFLYTLSNDIIRDVFKCNISIENLNSECLGSNLAEIFSNSIVKNILSGDLTPLIKYIEEKSFQYTSLILRSQVIENATKAWNNQNYNEFINLLDKVSNKELSNSLLLKYQIAKKKLK